jgi:hypothetical protein
MGAPDAQLTLTQRELAYYKPANTSDDSGVTLHLQWTDPSNLPWPNPSGNPNTWLNRETLQRLGFNCSVEPDSSDAARFYERQRPRKAFIALEYDGPRWRAWLDSYQRAVAQERAKTQVNVFAGNVSGHSHLVAIDDADLDPGKLRARHPDRSTVIILPAVIAITLQPPPNPGMEHNPNHPAQLVGRIQQLPSSIHVPRPFSDKFRSQHQGQNYRVQLRCGALLEPCVTGLEFPQ